jgi:hypothetical protein
MGRMKLELVLVLLVSRLYMYDKIGADRSGLNDVTDVKNNEFVYVY